MMQASVNGQQPIAPDPSSLQGKIMAGYQGWFRCPGDGAEVGWQHWSRSSDQIETDTLTFEMWPDMSDYSAEERFPVPGFTYPDGSEAELFSSHNFRTVLRHFEWMRQYGIDGAWLQHFVVDLPGGPCDFSYPSRSQILEYVRQAATQTNRIWAICFDMAAMPTEQIFEVMTTEWKKLVDSGITKDPQYLYEQGKPVLMVWGFYRGQNITVEVANQILDFFKNDPVYGVYLCGGCEWTWRVHPESGWDEVFRSFDAIVPWNIGNYYADEAGKKWARTDYWVEDLKEAQRVGMTYIPTVYPGFSWDNLMRKTPGTTNVPREEGRFFWKQLAEVARLNIGMAYLAMFDEVDEGTALFKVTQTPPIEAHFVPYQGVPSDWYLRLAGEGSRMIRMLRPYSETIPIKP